MTTRIAARRPPPPEGCPLDACLKFLSGAWTVRILWYLAMGPRKFGELRRDLGRISSKVLTERLRRMEAQRVVMRKVLATKPRQVEYRLTALGEELCPVLDAMRHVAEKLQQSYGAGG